jgi:hypothetical protein
MRHVRLAMKRLACVCAIVGAVVLTSVSFSAQGTTRVLVVTGGHAFEAEPFFKLFRDNPAITSAAAEHDGASASAWERDDLAAFDVIVLYDMPRHITPAQQAKLRSLFERGTGLVVLHHALVSFQDGPTDHLAGAGPPRTAGSLGQGGVRRRGNARHDPGHRPSHHSGHEGLHHRDEIRGFRVGGDVHPLLGGARPGSR